MTLSPGHFTIKHTVRLETIKKHMWQCQCSIEDAWNSKLKDYKRCNTIGPGRYVKSRGILMKIMSYNANVIFCLVLYVDLCDYRWYLQFQNRFGKWECWPAGYWFSSSERISREQFCGLFYVCNHETRRLRTM